MTAKRLLELNGDFHASPLIDALRRFHALCQNKGIPYCVIGGMAVVRNGAPRTTMDLDILTIREEWVRLLPLDGELTSAGPDSCADRKSGVTIDLLFAGDEWGMPFPLPDPRKVSEYDAELGAFFMNLHALVQLKMAVHLTKLREDGPGLAAKDLADAAELIRKNPASFSVAAFENYEAVIREPCLRLYEEILRSEERRRSKG